MKMKLAVYDGEFGLSVLELWDHATIDEMDAKKLERGSVRITEFVDIEFPELAKETVVSAQIKAIDAIIEEKTQSMLKEINELKTRKSELLAICFEG